MEIDQLGRLRDIREACLLIESYMVGGIFTATQFYVDVEGHPADRNLELALEELRFFAKELRILGVYPAHPFRARQR